MGFDSRSEYLQRVGRTGRAGKDGTAYLIAAPEEVMGVAQVADVINEVYTDAVSKPQVQFTKTTHAYTSSKVTFPKPTPDAKKALRGWLGALASKWKRLKMTPASVVNMAQCLSKAMGLGEIPLDKLHEKLSIKVKK
jgi:superfamily II DNA/RNA helicase